MPASPVVNASPLICRSKGGFLDPLLLLATEIAVPTTVAQEINHRGPVDTAASRSAEKMGDPIFSLDGL